MGQTKTDLAQQYRSRLPAAAVRKERGADIAAESARRLYRYQVPRPQRSVNLNDQELPDRYNQTRLTLLARDPHFLHAYWEVAPQDIAAMQQKIGPDFDRSTYTLRMHDVTSIEFNGQNANRTFDIDVAPHVNNWYINLWNDNVSYCSELGMRTPDGQFHSYAQSNVAMTPRENSSGRSDMIWMDVRANRNQAFVFTQSRAERIVGALKEAGNGNGRKWEKAQKMYISEDDIRAYYAGLSPMLKKVRAFRSLRNQTKLKNEKKRTRLDWSNPADREQISDITIPGVSKSDYYRKFMTGASAELLEKRGASEQLFSGGASEKQPAKGRKFFFEIWTELIVYGRTEPDAQVKLNGDEVKLREDGTFTLRYALPDGRIPLDFTAISHDRVETRKITTAVERMRTVYSP